MGQAVLKKIPKLKEWPRFSGEKEYDHMEFIRGIHMIKEDFEVPERLVTETFTTLFTRLAHIWCINLRQAHGHQSWTWWKTKLSTNGPMMLGDLKLKNTLNFLNLMLTRTQLYHGFANKKID
ncbi:hypothetical protein O181_011384 [Austropuccinia psidii MF-1]|uniref:Uncharacterized protein n=1 Tax=Austropuccinia psidii MF-1 TaxID=1389203 RepID=A0A9Q3GLT5_9BASI|nr:hypothetical protein [Austropuccinia psidii MF-1]